MSDRYEEALLVAVSVMTAFSENRDGPDDRASQMKAADAILRDVDPSSLVTVGLLLGALGTWGICDLIPRAFPRTDPKDWILGYVQSAFSVVDERG
jgi:hypothetical protein